MRIINPLWSAMRQSTDPQKAKAKKDRFLKGRKAGAEYLNQKHKFELTANSDPTGEFVTMSGREAKLINESLRENFIKAISKAGYKKRPILEHWKCVERGMK